MVDRQSFRQSHSEVGYTRDGDWLYFRIGRISYSVDSIQHPQAIRITVFSLQAAHLLAQTPFLFLPSWSPETIQHLRGLRIHPETRVFLWRGKSSRLLSHYEQTKRIEKEGGDHLHEHLIHQNRPERCSVDRSLRFQQIKMSWMNIDLKATRGRQTILVADLWSLVNWLIANCNQWLLAYLYTF